MTREAADLAGRMLGRGLANAALVAAGFVWARCGALWACVLLLSSIAAACIVWAAIDLRRAWLAGEQP